MILAKEELFAKLAESAPGLTTVVTPNLRLAQELAREFDSAQLARGLTVWNAPDILPFGAFLVRAYEDEFYTGTARMPMLLSPLQEQSLWQQAVEASEWSAGLLSPAQTAAAARDAWNKAHEWRIEGALQSWPGSEDTQAFSQWSRVYSKRTVEGGWIDSARLAGTVADWLKDGASKRPSTLVTYAFDIMPPQLRDFMAACRSAGVDVVTCGPTGVASTPSRIACKSPADELECAANWARARLEAGAGRIGVVVADLALRRNEVQRVFSRVMQPGYNLPGSHKQALPFNISLGAPLADHPLVDAALAVLELAGATAANEMDFARLSRMVRSPFIKGAEAEMATRARLDSALRESAHARLTLPRLLASISMSRVSCPLLAHQLGAVFEYAKHNTPGLKAPHEWVRHFSALLSAAGFAAGRTLDSEEFQTRAKSHDLLAQFAALDGVVPKMGFGTALAHFRRLCADTLFQPARFGKGSETPIQVLGVLESAGLEFDHLWVSGLTDEAWPLAQRPNPFIPAALQRKAGIPEASAETALELDRRITAHWFAAAREVVVSHPQRENDRDLAPSPLIASINATGWDALGVTRVESYRDRLHAERSLETIADGWAPALVTKTPRGGTRILVDQAACPFRAFAKHRLSARPLETPAPGLDAAARGQLLHSLFAGVWGALRSQAGLEQALSEGTLDSVIETAARAAVARVREDRPGRVEQRFAELECERLARLAREWLELERGRTPFEVVAREEKRQLEIGGLSLSGRIDRMDRLEQGGYALIDYKTGRASPNEWLDARPDDPQLPLYAISASEDISAVVFAKVRPREMRFMGLSRDANALPKVKPAQAWDGLLRHWEDALAELGEEFASGDARVDPKRPLKTCEHCGLQPLCRVYERYGVLEEGADESGDAE